jgi:hypothetical protein
VKKYIIFAKFLLFYQLVPLFTDFMAVKLGFYGSNAAESVKIFAFRPQFTDFSALRMSNSEKNFVTLASKETVVYFNFRPKFCQT